LVRRLDTWLGDGNYVMNRGIGGEQTAEALSRFATEMTSECPGSPGDCTAVILMHGTNDMEDNSVSPESATANLAFMIGQAKTRNIDTLLMTIIRDYDPDDVKWSDYRDLTLALAASENLPVVDTHASLCPDASCRNANYYLMGASPCNGSVALSVGHLDPDGYDVLTGLVQDQFPALEPTVPEPTSPTGDIADPLPAFVWPEVATARWYELDIDGAISWWEAAVHCSLGSCTANPAVSLAQGPHSWRVRGRNLRGLGLWSADTAFEVWGVPGTPTPSAPAGLFVDADPLNMPFGWEPYTWSEDLEATDYDLVVSDGGGPVHLQSFDASICAASTCTASPDQGLAAGSYTWTVQARNPAVAGPATAPMAFEIFDSVPGEATPKGPAGEHFEPLAPLYEWLPAPGATEYDIEVKDAGGNVDAQATGLQASVVCVAGTCSYVEGTVLTDADDYTLRVLGCNAIGDGPLSSTGVGFTVLACADPLPEELAALEPSPVTTAEVVTHCGPVSAAESAAYTIDAAGDLTVHTRDGFIAHGGFSVIGKLTVRSP
jgi:hypothetical protein